MAIKGWESIHAPQTMAHRPVARIRQLLGALLSEPYIDNALHTLNGVCDSNLAAALIPVPPETQELWMPGELARQIIAAGHNVMIAADSV